MRRPLFGSAPFLFALTLLFALPPVLRAAEPKVPSPAGADFENQGEYSGSVFVDMGDTAIGVQIVADGDGQFTAVGFQGGLPGDGWDRAPRQSGKGTLNNGAIEFKGQGYSSTVKDGVMTIGVAGVEIGKLKKQDRESPSLGDLPPAGCDCAVRRLERRQVRKREDG